MDTFEYKVCVQANNGSYHDIEGSAVETICAPLASNELALEELKGQFPVVENFIVQNEQACISGDNEVHMLIGSDYYWSFIGGEPIRLSDKLVMLNAKFGYLLSGPIQRLASEKKSSIRTTSFCQNIVMLTPVEHEKTWNRTEKWEDQIEKFWELDSVGILPKEKSAYEKFQSDINFVDNRYEVKLPFKENHPLIGDNYTNSLLRLKSLKTKLNKNPGMMEAYDDIIQEQIRDGMVEVINEDENNPPPGNIMYLPHSAVLREDKETSTTRVVYDASAKSKNGPSLNDCLYKGPSLTPFIFDALMKFRVHDIGITADIEKAYLQISVYPPHRDFLRFLWFANIKDKELLIVKLRFLRVIFGATCSQFLLNSVIRAHINRYIECDPEFVQKMKDALYVDDLTSGTKSVMEGEMFYKKCKTRFREGNFNLRKWRTNNKKLRKGGW